MKKLASIVMISFLIFGLISTASFNFFCEAQSGLNIKGIIFSDTTWTKTISPINLTGSTAIAKGATVIVEPGVTVHFNAYDFQVNGTFRVIGTDSDPITLNGDYRHRPPAFGGIDLNGELEFSSECNGWEERTGTGCIIEKARIVSLSIFAGNTVKINNNVISGPIAWGALSIGSGNSIISNNRLYNHLGIGVSGEGQALIFNNTLVHTNGITVAGSGSSTISRNVLYDGFAQIVVSGSTVSVTDNVIANGIGFKATAGNLTFERNLVLNCSEGFALYSYEGNATIQHNTIANCHYGVESPPTSAKVIYNNLINNQASIVCRFGLNFDATNNWWGTTDATAISETILDYQDDYNAGNITFIPFLQAPDSEAPSIDSFVIPIYLTETPNPTTSPLPTVLPTEIPTTPTFTVNPTASPSVTLNIADLLGIITVLLAVIVGLLVALVLVLRRKTRP